MINATLILEAVAWRFDVSVVAIRGDGRSAAVVLARHAACYLLRTLRPDLSLNDIGERLGGMHHTSVMHAVDRMERMVASDAQVARCVQRIKRDMASLAEARAPIDPMPEMTNGRAWWNEQAGGGSVVTL